MPAFWFHYNKPESRKQGRNVLTVHYQKQCHLVTSIDTRGVDLQTRDRRDQPRCVIAGRGIVKIVDGAAVITPEGGA